MMKKRKPATAAKNTVKNLSGFENLFLGPGTVVIDAKKLEGALWDRLVDATIKGMGHLKPGFEHYALDGTLEHFNQGKPIRKQLKKLVVQRMGRDPFPNDDVS